MTHFSRLPQIAASLQPRVDAALKQGAELVAQRARERVPDDAPIGEGLVDAIHVTESGNAYEVVAGDKDAFYGHMVEFGTSHSAPHPFLVPALEESRAEIVKALKEALG